MADFLRCYERMKDACFSCVMCTSHYAIVVWEVKSLMLLTDGFFVFSCRLFVFFISLSYTLFEGKTGAGIHCVYPV